jgi:tetratricopeptide (TPR) repeat protein
VKRLLSAVREMKWMVQILAGLLLLAVGCSKDSNPSADNPANKDFVALGWLDFEGQKYDAAITNFTEAYNKATAVTVRGEALSGRAWSYAYKRDLFQAKGDFVFASGLVGVAPAVMNDIRVGAAFVHYSLNEFSPAASYANAALADNPSYVFSHDSKVTAKRVRLLLAQSYYAMGQFTQCAAQLDIIDSSGAPHLADPTSLLGSITAILNTL